MNSFVQFSRDMGLVLVMASLTVSTALAEDTRMAVAKSEIDRETVVRENVRLGPQEAKDFWPIYKEYRAKIGPVATDLINLVKKYADLYPNVNENQAEDLFEDYLELKEDHARIQAKYLRKMRRKLNSKHVIRFAQIENKLDTAVDFEAAATVPLVN